MNFEGIIIGAGTFLIIGLLHPIVIKTEYYIGAKSWPVFLIMGLLCVALSFFCETIIISTLLSILGFSLLWSILELFQQEKRVEKGWFPSNPHKRNGAEKK
jgi:uncharacterized membrane protein